MSEKAKRYAIFAIGLFINSLGVSFITTADLGTSPISSIPYVLSLNAPLSLGQFTILFNLLIVLVQLPILKSSSSGSTGSRCPLPSSLGGSLT